MRNVLLIGCPNAGKSSLFNNLTGLDRKVSNYSGITVDSGQGQILGTDLNLIDLPGIYNLFPQSIDEYITVATLFGNNPEVKSYSGIFVVIDFSRLEASLALAMEVKKYFSHGVHLIVNKYDLVIDAQTINWKKLSELIGIEILTCSALQEKKESIKEITEFIKAHLHSDEIHPLSPLEIPAYTQKILDWKTENYNVDNDEVKLVAKIENEQRLARSLLLQVASKKDLYNAGRTYRIDKVLLHPVVGMMCFLTIFYLIFHALYTWSAPLMELMENLVLKFGDLISGYLSDGLFKSLMSDGIFAGVGGVIVFLPQIMILFFFLSLLEQSGYIARAAFLTDRLMSYFGLNGKAFLPFLSGFACAVPAIMSTRTIADRRERMATLLVIPLITCSARLPVYILLIGTFIPAKNIGPFHSQALALFFLYFLGSIVALIFAKIFRLSFFKGETKSFFMEMPIYQKPRLKVAGRQMWRQGKVFLTKAGTIIFALSIIIWFLSTFPRTDFPNESAEVAAAMKLEQSYIGQMGKVIEPVIKPLGYDWKIGVGLIIAFGARELFVSGLGTIFALGDVDENSKTLKEQLLANPHYTMAMAWSLLIFFAFACQCMSTLAIVKKETQSIKWPVLMFTYMSILAYFSAFLTYRILL